MSTIQMEPTKDSPAVVGKRAVGVCKFSEYGEQSIKSLNGCGIPMFKEMRDLLISHFRPMLKATELSVFR